MNLAPLTGIAFASKWLISKLNQSYPVSYTHLDVYKRQVITKPYTLTIVTIVGIRQTSIRRITIALIRITTEMCIRDRIRARAAAKQDRVSQRSGGMTSSKSLTGFINKETRTRSYYCLLYTSRCV